MYIKIETCFSLILFALIHELGHLLCGMVVGFKPKKIGIGLYGFNIEFKTKYEYGNKYLIKNICVSIAGPVIILIL